jgi:hypothetical protein
MIYIVRTFVNDTMFPQPSRIIKTKRNKNSLVVSSYGYFQASSDDWTGCIHFLLCEFLHRATHNVADDCCQNKRGCPSDKLLFL